MKTVCRGLIVLFLGTVLYAGAITVPGAAFEYAPEFVPDREAILDHARFSPLDSPPRKFAIECFDVREDGFIALGTQTGETKIISVYDNTGAYQYGFTCVDRGDFGLEWEEDDILVYSVRSDLAFQVNSSGEVEEIREITNTDHNDSYWDQVVFARERRSGADRYCLRNDMGFLNLLCSSYSQLIRIHPDGEEQLLYDVNSEQMVITILFLSGAIFFTWIVLWMLYRQYREQRRNQQTRSPAELPPNH